MKDWYISRYNKGLHTPTHRRILVTDKRDTQAKGKTMDTIVCEDCGTERPYYGGGCAFCLSLDTTLEDYDRI